MLGMSFDKSFTGVTQAPNKIFRPNIVHTNISKHVVVSPNMRRSTYKHSPVDKSPQMNNIKLSSNQISENTIIESTPLRKQ